MNDDENEKLELGFLPEAVDGVPDPSADAPLDPALATIVMRATQIDGTVPREMMWARIRQQRNEQRHAAIAPQTVSPVAATQAAALVTPLHPRRSAGQLFQRVVAIAATLVFGVAIGRYALPGREAASDSPTVVASASTTPGSTNGSANGIAAAPLPAPAPGQATAPAVVAMEEHLARTVALLVAVRDKEPANGPGADVEGWARELLNTTRLLIDEPQLRDERTRRLLQDLELVLVQIIQARGTSAPEARRAPSETMRETNLLPRVRAAVTASRTIEEPTLRGVAEE